MINGKRIVVVMPAYNAERTIEKTAREVLDQEIVDLVIVVDDASQDATVSLAQRRCASSARGSSSTRIRPTAGTARIRRRAIGSRSSTARTSSS